MNFLSFFARKQDKKDFFLAFLLKPFSIGCILFEEKNGALSIIKTSEEKLTLGLDSLDIDEFVDALDVVISLTEEGGWQNVLVQKAVFSVPYHWVEEGKIKKEFLIKLKKASSELDLVPIGFIVSAEAMLFSLQKKEGAPISSIFVEILDSKIIVYLVRAGNIIEVREGERIASLSSSVELILKQVESLEILPSKIIVFPHKDSETIAQELLSFPWNRDLPFLHLPKIKVLEKSFEEEAVINGVATQMGFDLSKSQEEKSDSQPLSRQEEMPDEVFSNNFGFLRDVDVQSQQEEKKEAQEADIDKKTEQEEEEALLVEEKQETIEIQQPGSFPAIGRLSGFLSLIKSVFQKTINFFKKIFRSVRVRRLFSFGLPFTGKIAFGLFIIFGFLAGAIASYYFLILKAEVVIFLDKKIAISDIDVVFSYDKPTSVLDKVVKINSIEEILQGEQKKEATGKQETGEKASGEIVVYNKTDQKKTFSKGAIIVSPNGREFEFLDSFAIDATGTFSATLTSAKAKVVAAKFGPEYNLASGTNFTFKDFPTSSFVAKNESAFLGGTKKEVVVVSASDLETLSKNILDSLSGKAFSEIKKKLKEEDEVLPFIFSQEFVEKKYDKKEQEESSDVGINAKVKFVSAFYNKQDIEKFIKETKQNDIPDYFFLDESSSKKEVKNIKIDKNKKVTATVSMNLVYVPRIDNESLRSKIVKKNPQLVKEDIGKIKGVSEVNVVFRNNIDFLPSFLPFSWKNIEIKAKVNE